MNKKISYNTLENIISDDKYGNSNSTNHRNWEHLKKLLLRVLREELSLRQREMMLMFFFKHMTITQIAEELHVNKSTVSRTMRRGICNVKKYIQYYDLRN